MEDRAGLMMTAALLLLVAWKGEDEEVCGVLEKLQNFGEVSTLTNKYGSAAVALTKMIKDIDLLL